MVRKSSAMADNTNTLNTKKNKTADHTEGRKVVNPFRVINIIIMPLWRDMFLKKVGHKYKILSNIPFRIMVYTWESIKKN